MSEKKSPVAACHRTDLPRVNRIAGQIAGVRKMIEDERHCPEILIQLRAVRSAVKGLEASILERHLGHCVAEGFTSGDPDMVRAKINELKDLFRKYDE